MSSILDSPKALLTPRDGDFLMPFLRLPAVRLCVGFTLEDGAIVYSEDLGARQLTIVGAPRFGCTPLGVPFMIMNGTTDFLTGADASWNSVTGPLTVLSIAAMNALGDFGIVGKLPGGNQNSFILFNSGTTTTRLRVTPDGTTTSQIDVSKTSSAQAPPGQFGMTVARYIPSTEMKLWPPSGGVSVTNTTTIPAAIHNSTAPLTIGQYGNGGGFAAGKLALVVVCAAALDDAHIDRLYSHARLWGVAQP
jgi:hypothetical protein